MISNVNIRKLTMAQLYDMISYGSSSDSKYFYTYTAYALTGLPNINYIDMICIVTPTGEKTSKEYVMIVQSGVCRLRLTLAYNEKESLIDKWLME